MAIWLLSRSECGTTAAALSEIIGVTYKTAWLMLHKIRHAISESEDDRLLSGIVRVNPACYGRPHNPSVFRHPQEHPFLVGSSVDEQGSPLQIKLVLLNVHQHMNESKGILRSGIQFFTNRHIDPQAHDLEFVKNQYARNRIRALLEVARAACRWINTTFHSLGRKHLQAYLNEFGYRFNQSLLDQPPFLSLLTHCASSKKIRYADLTTAAA
ncbi:transposase [Paenibacillus sp. HJGM_3]|uniref:transposase n=1 Tax=Paenibacillus sp. HJGM_3 TaxID=3379816 RepID=UPI00385D2624